MQISNLKFSFCNLQFSITFHSITCSALPIILLFFIACVYLFCVSPIVIMINPDFAEVYVNLGNVYAAKGDRENAILHLQKFVTLSKNNPRLQRLIPQAENLIRQLQEE